MRIVRPLFLFFVLFAAGCQTAPPTAARADSKPQVVAAARVEKADLASEIELAAEFRAYQEADLFAKVAGYLKNIQVDIGSTVKQGQVLATLEAPELNEELQQAIATEKRVQLEVGRARGDVARFQSALQLREVTFQRVDAVNKQHPRLLAQQEIDDASSKFQEAHAQLEAAKANLSAAEQQIAVAQAAKARVTAMTAYLTITAPFSGMITKRYADPGAMIQAGTASQSQALPVVRISEVHRLRLVVAVPESIVPRIRAGDPIEVRVDSLQRILQGRVSRFTGSVATATRTMDTQIDIPNPAFALKPGMFAHVIIPVDRRKAVVAVPVLAVLERNGPVVLVINDKSEIEERRIKKGLATPEHIEVLQGLTGGELVVAANGAQLKAGQRVTPKIREQARR